MRSLVTFMTMFTIELAMGLNVATRTAEELRAVFQQVNIALLALR